MSSQNPVKVSDYIVHFLARQGVTHVFELSGGMITHLLDSMARLGSIRVVSMHHEQAAAFAAEGHARMNGVPGVAMATSGPGATNLLTGIGSCYFDSTPAVFITGQVNRHEMKGNRPVRQLGFQETDIVTMARPITKAAIQVIEPEKIPEVLSSAFTTALSGRPGPVLVDIPMDVQRLSLVLPEPKRFERPAPEPRRIARGEIDKILEVLQSSSRPLILVGGGLRSSRAERLFRRVVDRLGVPVVHSLMGVDALGCEHPLRMGMIGSYGNRWCNHAVGNADMLLVLGSRLDIRQTGADAEGFARGRRIVQVDCDPGEVNTRVKGVLPLFSDLADFLAALLELPPPKTNFAGWREQILQWQSRWPDTAEQKGIEGLNPNLFLKQLGEASVGVSAFAVDVGQHQMWAAQSLRLHGEQRFLTSGGMGSMGFGLPAAIGVAMAMPNQPVVVIAGDGGFQNNIQELQTVVRNRLPLKIIILNNKSHGMVRQFQESYFEGRFQSTVIGYNAPDFSRLAEAYGIPSRRLDAAEVARGETAAVSAALKWLWADSKSPSLLEVAVPISANAYPKLAFGRPITEMEPDAKPLDMEGT